MLDQVLPEMIASWTGQPHPGLERGCSRGGGVLGGDGPGRGAGTAEFRDRVKIYATDVDEDALARAAAQGSFAET